MKPDRHRGDATVTNMRPCRHLDYSEGKFTGCEIHTCAPHFPEVRYWLRSQMWTQNEDGSTNPAKVQFCGAGRGRINGIFQCYNGEMPCYEPAP